MDPTPSNQTKYLYYNHKKCVVGSKSFENSFEMNIAFLESTCCSAYQNQMVATNGHAQQWFGKAREDHIVQQPQS